MIESAPKTFEHTSHSYIETPLWYILSKITCDAPDSIQAALANDTTATKSPDKRQPIKYHDACCADLLLDCRRCVEAETHVNGTFSDR